MNIALILSTFIIGASTLNTPDNLALPPTSDMPLPPIQNNTAKTTPKTQSRAQQAEQDRNARLNQARNSRTSGSGYGYSGRSQQQNMRPVMPTAPTDSSVGSQVGQSYNFLPPTANAASAGTDVNGGYVGLPGPMNVPTSPTRARPGEAETYASRRAAEEQNRRLAASRNSASSQPQLAPKAFSNINQQSPSSSPYMNLFRTGNNNGTIDNYTTLVKPQLDQQGTNQKFGADIHGLENSTHVQGLNIRQLNRETQTLQGVNATQYFMNYGDYYQGAR
jgi:hypothetical protein